MIGHERCNPKDPIDEREEAAGRRALEAMGIHTEDLGSKRIAGLMADGNRTVQIVAAGPPGIDKPIKIVLRAMDCQGFASDDVEYLIDNSRNGRTTTEVVD